MFAIDADADSGVEGHLRMAAGLDEHIGSQRALRGTLVRDDDQLDTAFLTAWRICRSRLVNRPKENQIKQSSCVKSMRY